MRWGFLYVWIPNAERITEANILEDHCTYMTSNIGLNLPFYQYLPGVLPSWAIQTHLPAAQGSGHPLQPIAIISNKIMKDISSLYCILSYHKEHN